jgi:polyphosphate:AMP phosphotransferase
MWRFWRTLPPKGEIGIYVGAWYTTPLIGRILGKTGSADFDRQMQSIKRLENMLATEGALILKFWFHLDKKKQKKRLQKLEESERTKWRIEESPLGGSKHYEEVKSAAEQMMQITGTDQAPWIPVNATNKHYKSLVVMRTILDAIQARLAEPPAEQPVPAPVRVPDIDGKTLLSTLDLSHKLEKESYKKQLEKYQDRLNELVWDKKFRKHSVVLVFEGNDAAGKGGAIRRVIQFLDPRRYRVNQYAAPTEEERAQPYLWRFWRRIPQNGHVGIFDRSWYGRVLVERVEKFCSEADWRRAYGEINDFEAEMSQAGIVVIKFWLAIDKDEQELRFKAREETGYKRYKITDEDWRNREKWDEYTEAVCDMIDYTSTSIAPWTIVEANDKYYARIKVLKTICQQIAKRLK